MIEENPFQPPHPTSSAIPRRSENKSRNGGDSWVFFAIVLLFPGLILACLFLVLIPTAILLSGRVSWAAAFPLANSLAQVFSLVARFRSSRSFANLTFSFWAVGSILISVGLIADLQISISSFDGECGNALFGPMLMQLFSCGTIAGMIVLTFDDSNHRNS